MVAEKLWFSHSVEGLFVRGLGPRLTPALRAKVLAQGIDLDRLKPGYPIEDIVAVCRALLPSLWPTLSEAEGFQLLGNALLQGYSQTLLGTAMVQMMKLIGPRRSLERMQKNFRTGGNYIETRFTALGPTSVELWLSDVTGVPTFWAGMVEEGARMTGTKNIRVVVHAESPPSATLRVDWDA